MKTSRPYPIWRIGALCLLAAACGEEPPPEPKAPAPKAASAPAPVPEAELAPPPIFADVVWARGVPVGIVPLSASLAKRQAHYTLVEVEGGVEVTEVHPQGDLAETGPTAASGRSWRSISGPEGSRRVVHRDAGGETVRVDQIVDGGVKVVRQDGVGERLDLACAFHSHELDAAGRTLAEVCIGDTGAPIADGAGVARRTYTLDDLGRRAAEATFVEGARPIQPIGEPHFGVRRVWDDGGRLIQRSRLDLRERLVPVEAAGYASEEWDYDDEGRLVERRYEGSSGRGVAGPGGWAVETRRYEAAEGGEQVVISTFGVDGDPIRRAGGGVARAVEVRDVGGRRISRAVFDTSGTPTVETEGRVHRVTYGYDASGRLVDTTFYGAGGGPVIHAVRGVHREQTAYDEEGRELMQVVIDGEGQPVAGPEGWARRVRRYNAKGQLDAVAFERIDGTPVGRASDGVARFFRYYDLSGHLAQIASSGADGRPTAQEGGFGRAVFEHDAEGRVVAEAWFDLIEAPMINPLRGCARETVAYDDRGFERERRCLDPDGAPRVSSAWGAAGIRWQKDAHGRVVRETWLGIDGEATLGPGGVASRLTRHDGRGAILAVSLLDGAGRPTFGRAGWSERRHVRGPQGEVLAVRTVDTLGNPVDGVDGVAETRTTRAGRLTKVRYQGADGVPMGGLGGVAGRDVTRDGFGRVAREGAVDVSGLPVRDPVTGCATVETTRDAAGDVVTTRCLDPRGLLTEGLGGWAVLRRDRDDKGRPITTRLEDATGALVVGAEGWAREVRMFDPRGWLARLTREGVDGAPVSPAVVQDRDTMGRVVRERAVDAEGQPAMNAQGWATRLVAYDTLGRQISEGYSGTEAQATRRQIVRTRYGVAGRVVETRYLAPTGEPAIGPDGWAIEARTHDARGRLVGLRYFDAAREPGLKGHPHVGERHLRDAMGRLLERRAMAATDVLVDGFGLGKQRWAIERQRFDAHGRRTSLATFDVEDRPVVGGEGVHVVRWRWDPRGQMIAQERLLAPNRRAPGGWAWQDHRYDAFGRLVTIAYQDGMGQASTVWNGVGLVELAYGRDGRLATMSWHRPDKEPMDAKVCFPGSYCGKRPVHEARYRYAGAGEAVEMTLHDRKGTRRATLDCAEGECF